MVWRIWRCGGQVSSGGIETYVSSMESSEKRNADLGRE